MKDYVNWGILAPGIIAASMAKAMSQMSKSDKRIRLYAVASRDLQRATDFATKGEFEKAYGSYEELLLDENLDAVYIANPHAFHFESVMSCLEHNKHVLCEKPAGCNLDQLTKMIETARSKNLFFMEAMWTAFNPCVNKIREAINEGVIGDLQHIESRFCNRIPYDPNSRMWAPSLAGGALLDLGIYNLYFSSMMNNFEAVESFCSNVRMYKDVDAWNSVNLTYKNGVKASFQSACDMTASSDTHDAWIYGTKGYIYTKNFFLAQKAEVHTFKSEWGNDNSITQIIEEPFKVNGYEYELLHCTDCILQGKIESPIHTFERSIELCTMMDKLRVQWGFKYPFEK